MGVGVNHMEKTQLDLAYLRLTDCAPFVVAKELGFFAQYGLDVKLHQEVSWASVRDKLVSGKLDGAQMLAPLPAMTTLGVSGVRAPLLTGLVLSRNGNAITLSAGLWHEMTNRSAGLVAGVDAAIALKKSIVERKDSKLTFAVVHAFSGHMLLLRRWLRLGGIDPDVDIRIIVVPPSQVVDSLAMGIIDGYCVGEPWNTSAVQQGIGVIAAVGSQVTPNSAEKVLCVSEQWHQQNPTSHLRLRLALMQAGQWLARRANVEQCAELLSMERYLNLTVDALLPSLSGQVQLVPLEPPVTIEDFQLFDSHRAGCPDQAATTLLVVSCAELLGKRLTDDVVDSIIKTSVRPDLFLEAQALFSGDVMNIASTP